MTPNAMPDADRDEIAPLVKRTSAWRSTPVDALILLALLIAANWFLGHDDPGWQRTNPTPWLLLPFFLGGRYGAAAGLVGALLATAAVLVLQWALGNMTPQALFTAKPYFFLSFVIGAAVGTVVHRLVTGPAEQLRRHAISLADRNQRLEEDGALYRANEEKLQQALLLHGADNVSLHGEIQRLFAGDRDRFDHALLDLFVREFGIIAAALYRDDTGRHSSLTRTAATGGDESAFPEKLPDPGAPLADAALAGGQLATWKSQWDGGVPTRESEEVSASKPHLAAIPWRQSAATSPSPRAILLIGRMEFGKIRWDAFAGIEAVLAWCLGRQEPAALAGDAAVDHETRILPQEAFAAQIEVAHRLESRHHLPGRLILFAADPQAPGNVLEDFARRLGSLVPPGTPVGALGDGEAIPMAIGFLDPSASSEVADATARQLLSRSGAPEGTVKHHVFTLAEAVRIAGGGGPSAAVQSHAAAPASTGNPPNDSQKTTAATASSAVD